MESQKDRLYAELSMLLSGDLAEQQAAALRVRIDAEPEVAAAWDRVGEVARELEALPEIAPPAELDDAVLRAEPAAAMPSAPPARTPWAGWLGWAAAAAAVSWVLLIGSGAPPTDAQIVLADGSQWVDGHAMVVAGDQLVEVDGAARITVEPPREALRVLDVEAEDPMQRRDVLVGAMAGAVVTVAVAQGSARMWPAAQAGSEGVSIAAGESKTVGIARTPHGLQVERKRAPAGETAAETIARLTEERDALAQALEESRFEGAMAKGQLAVHTGEPIPWDDSVPEEHLPDAVRAGIDAFLVDHPEVELADLDCAEFPCIATFEPLGEGDPMEVMRDLPREYAEALFGDDAAVMASAAAHEGDDGARTELVSVAAVPAERKDGEWATRAQYRTESITQPFLDGADEQDVDIE